MTRQVDYSGSIPKLTFKERSSYKSKTKEHDEVRLRNA